MTHDINQVLQSAESELKQLELQKASIESRRQQILEDLGITANQVEPMKVQVQRDLDALESELTDLLSQLAQIV